MSSLRKTSNYIHKYSQIAFASDRVANAKKGGTHLSFPSFTPSLFLFILPTFVIRIDRRGCSYRPTRMTFVDVSQCQTVAFVLPNRCFCSSSPPFPYLTPSFSFHIFPCFPQSAVLSFCVHPLVAVLKTVSRAYNNIMCASTMRCFKCKQLLKRA